MDKQSIINYFNQDDAPDNLAPYVFRVYENTNRICYKFKHNNYDYDLLDIKHELLKIGHQYLVSVKYLPLTRQFSIVVTHTLIEMIENATHSRT